MNAPCRRRAIWAEQSAVINAAQHTEVRHETENEARQDADAKTDTDALPVVQPVVAPVTMCPKCGKIGKQGMHKHIMYCKGLI